MMTKKEKRKKEKVKKKEKTEQIKESENDKINTDGDDKTNSSRSRSRGRRSLSSLFRRSRGRTESGERTSLLETDDSANTASRQADPRTDPRGHLQRMTVREALARNRGRSPSRRTKKLERQILDNESNLSSENLSISLPHLDHLTEDQPTAPLAMPESLESRNGSTMPRMRKKRVHSDRKSAEQFIHSDFLDSKIPDTQDSTINILPLDKRKYLISKDHKINEPSQDNSVEKIRTPETPRGIHSNSPINDNLHELTDREKEMRESLNAFLSLREKKPHDIHERINEVKSTLPKIDVIKSTPPSTVLHSMEELPKLDRISDVKNKSDENTLDTLPQNIIESASDDDAFLKHSDTETSIPDFENMQTKTDKFNRARYVSPRRFSRASRTSETSNKSGPSDSNTSVTPEQMLSEPKRLSVKYRRHFSRESRKHYVNEKNENEASDSKRNLMVDASTSMGNDEILSEPEGYQDLSANIKQSNVCSTETSAKSNDKQFIANKVIEDGDELILPAVLTKATTPTTVVEAEICPEIGSLTNSAGPLQREIKVLDHLNSQNGNQIPTSESVFRPIKPDDELDLPEDTQRRESVNAITKQQLDLDTDKIEVISSDILTPSGKDENIDKSSTEHKKHKESLKESEIEHEDKDNKAERKHSKKFWSGRSKKEKRKSKKKKEKQRKESVTSEKLTNKEKESVESIIEQKQHEPELKKSANDIDRDDKSHTHNKKRKSILKKRFKDKLMKTAKTKPLKRTASLSKCLDRRESLILEERRKSTSFVGLRSKSMDDLRKKAEAKEAKVTLKLNKKEVTLPANKMNDKIINDTKDVKPQPKLSIAAIVALRAKISRMKKAKQQQKRDSQQDAENNIETKDKSKEEISPVDDSPKETEENEDMSVAKVFYENEINTSIGKSENSISIIEDMDQEVKDLVYDKRIKFSTPYCDDTISEEEMIKQRQRNTRLTSRRESKVRQRQRRVIDCCKKGIAFLFSHIGLCSLVVGYCILGGIVFKALEGENEIKQKRQILEIRQNYTERIYRCAFESTLTKGSRELFIKEVNDILKEFSVKIHSQTKEAGWDGKEIKTVINEQQEEVEAEPEQWSYPSSLLYAITVMTTIGYGHVAPKTDEGRIMTIAYAVLGIPLTLLCLTNIGDLMAHGFRSLYGKVCCGLCCILFRPRRQRRLDPERGLTGAEERMLMQENEKSGELIHVPTSVCLLLMSSYIMLGTVLFGQWEGWDVVTGTYFCFITLSTIGFGDVVPGMSQSDWNQQEKLVSCALYLVFGLSLIAMCFNLVQEDVKAKCKWLGMKLGIIDKPVSSV